MARCPGALVFRNEARAGGGCREVSQTGCTGELRIITIVGTPHPFKMTQLWRCGRWEYSDAWFPAYGIDVADQNHAPFAIVIERPDTITAWDIEAYDLGQTEQDRRNAGPRPSTS